MSKFSIAQIETFAQQQPNLEIQIKNLCQGIVRHVEKQTETYERDILRLSELFAKLHGILQADTTTPGKRWRV